MVKFRILQQPIVDGKLVRKNMDEMGKSGELLQEELRKTGGPGAEIGEFYYAGIDANGEVHAWKSAESH